MQGARYGRCRHRKAVYIFFDVLYFFLMLYAKALFLVQNKQAEVFEFYVCGKKPVRADKQIDLAARRRR